MPKQLMKMTDRTIHQNTPLSDLNYRSREVFRRVVEGYLETGVPVGSRSLTRSLTEQISAATVRNVMQDLEFLGLLGSPIFRLAASPHSLACACSLMAFSRWGNSR